jgi:uncharacterized membrane protein YbhN (UPF0104 family)
VLVLVLPKLSGASWTATTRVLTSISLPDGALLVGVWLAGLCSYTLVMRAALPGLSTCRALTLNVGGSAVSNLLPFGGAAGVGLNFAMATSWGFPRSSFATFTALTTLVNVAAKLALPVAAVVVVAASGQLHSRDLVVCATAGVSLLAVACLFVAIGVTDNPFARFGRRALARLASNARVARRVAGGRGRVVALMLELRGTAQAGWRQVGLGMTGYLALQALLLWLILGMLHSGLPIVAVFAGFALERALTLAVVTPGGVGIAQTGAAATLIAFGGAPAIVAAGVLLYSLFTFFLEIPMGAAATLAWWLCDRSSRATARRAQLASDDSDAGYPRRGRAAEAPRGGLVLTPATGPVDLRRADA